MNTYTVSFFGHRRIENALEIERRLERLMQTLLRNKEYVEFLVGRDGEFDQIVSSTIRHCRREYRSDNSSHIWVLPYLTTEFRDNEESFRDYYDEIEVCEAAAGSHYKNAHQTRNRAMVDRSDLVVFCIINVYQQYLVGTLDATPEEIIDDIADLIKSSSHTILNVT